MRGLADRVDQVHQHRQGPAATPLHRAEGAGRRAPLPGQLQMSARTPADGGPRSDLGESAAGGGDGEGERYAAEQADVRSSRRRCGRGGGEAAAEDGREVGQVSDGESSGGDLYER